MSVGKRTKTGIPKKSYSDEFKIDAVKQLIAGTVKRKELAAQLGVTAGMLYKWKTNFQNGAITKRRGIQLKNVPNDVTTPKLTLSEPLPINKEAIIYLQHAEREIMEQMRARGKTKLSQDQLYTLLALNCLRGTK